jgi:hypothetical protein
MRIDCGEPNCEEYANFDISHGTATYHFCTKHVWFRVQRWLNRLPKGEQVCVTSISGKAETPLAHNRTLRDMRSDDTTGQLVVPATLDLESAEGSPKGTDQTVTPGEVPAMRKPARKRRVKVPV